MRCSLFIPICLVVACSVAKPPLSKTEMRTKPLRLGAPLPSEMVDVVADQMTRCCFEARDFSKSKTVHVAKIKNRSRVVLPLEEFRKSLEARISGIIGAERILDDSSAATVVIESSLDVAKLPAEQTVLGKIGISSTGGEEMCPFEFKVKTSITTEARVIVLSPENCRGDFKKGEEK